MAITKLALNRDREELAWAAGLFDGEGTMFCRITAHCKPALVMALVQATNDGSIPAVLARFQSAMGFGSVCITRHPGQTTFGTFSKKTQYRWRLDRFEHIQQVVAMLWSWLSPVKREQAKAALTEYHSKWVAPRRGRFRSKAAAI